MPEFECLNCGEKYDIEQEDELECSNCGRRREKIVKLGKILDPGDGRR